MLAKAWGIKCKIFDVDKRRRILPIVLSSFIAWPLKMGPDSCPKRSAIHCRFKLCKLAKDRRSQRNTTFKIYSLVRSCVVPTQVIPSCICKVLISNPTCSTVCSLYRDYRRHWHDAASIDRLLRSLCFSFTYLDSKPDIAYNIPIDLYEKGWI